MAAPCRFRQGHRGRRRTGGGRRKVAESPPAQARVSTSRPCTGTCCHAPPRRITCNSRRRARSAGSTSRADRFAYGCEMAVGICEADGTRVVVDEVRFLEPPSQQANSLSTDVAAASRRRALHRRSGPPDSVALSAVDRPSNRPPRRRRRGLPATLASARRTCRTGPDRRMIPTASITNAALELLPGRCPRWRSSRCRCGSCIGSAVEAYGYPMDRLRRAPRRTFSRRSASA